MESYKTLIAALNPYRGDMDLDNAQRRCLLEGAIANGVVDLRQLTIELTRALSDSEFDWAVFARDNLLIIDSSDTAEIAAYVKSLFQGSILK